MFRKVLFWVFIAGVVLYITKNPVGAAHTGKTLGAGAASVAAGFGAFLGGLLS